MSLDYSIVLNNGPEMISAFEAATTGSTELLSTAVTQATIFVQGAARIEAPKRTGRLASSIGYKVVGLKGVVAPTVKYAEYVERGTGLYGPYGQLIYPKNSKVLATKSNPGFGTAGSGGYYVIGAYSRGQEANPFFARAIAMSLPTIEAQFGMVPVGITKLFSEVK